jgi:putative flippase GtrA
MLTAMVTLAQPNEVAEPPAPHPVLDVVVPVYNEERALAGSVRRLRAYLDAMLPWPAVVTIADNGSTDSTPRVADALAAELAGVRVRHLPSKGRGLALRTAWAATDADVVAYMDVDLSTSLTALLPLVAPLVSGHSDLAIGSRLARGSRVVRGPKREVVSRCYNLILRACLRNGFSDAQCGFKAVRAEVARRLLPQIADDGWFFDTELLVLAERSALRIHEVPVDWVDDADSRVAIMRTAAGDLRGLARLLVSRRGAPPTRTASTAPVVHGGAVYARFARVGVASTVAYLVGFFVLRSALGDYGANALSMALCTAANLAVNRWLTFSAAGPLAARRLVVGGATVWATSVAVTSVALLAVHTTGTDAWVPVLAALVVANGLAAVGRFVLLHAWMFESARSDGPRGVLRRDGVE